MPKGPEKGTPDHRMVEYSSQEDYEQKQAELRKAQEGAQGASRAASEDGLPTVSAERRAELKQAAREMIEERLKARRKARRLMRGGDVPK